MSILMLTEEFSSVTTHFEGGNLIVHLITVKSMDLEELELIEQQLEEVYGKNKVVVMNSIRPNFYTYSYLTSPYTITG